MVNLLSEIGSRHDVKPGIVAIAWVLSNPAVTGAITGAHSIEQIEEVATAAEFRLSESELNQINTFIIEHP
jgi:aryl-alcohol dehydrogenase-like predicted oxidoreductase